MIDVNTEVCPDYQKSYHFKHSSSLFSVSFGLFSSPGRSVPSSDSIIFLNSSFVIGVSSVLVL